MGKKKGAIWNFLMPKEKVLLVSTVLKSINSPMLAKWKSTLKTFKCPAGLKNVLSVKPPPTLSSETYKYQPLTVDVSELNKAGSSSAESFLIPAPRTLSSPSPLSATSSDSGSVPLLSPSTTSRGMTSFLDHMDTQTNEMLNQSLAKAVFISGCPLSLVEHPLWREFFKKIRPSYTLPSRYRISSTYLDAQYTEMQNEINKQLQATKNLHLQCDGWSNIKNESIINFVISKPEPFFVDFKMTKTERHNSEYLAKLIETVIEKYGSDKFMVIIADNAPNMKAALILLKEKYPHIVTLGCLAHLLHLLCSDILGCQTVKSFFVGVIDIVKKIKNGHILQALFNEISSEKRFKDRVSLKLPGQTRWGSHLYCLQSLKSNKVVLQTLAVNEKADLEPDTKRRLLDDGVFWMRIEKMIELLRPIVDLITAIESNEPKIHRVIIKLNDLEKSLTQQLPLSPLQKTEEKKILTKFKERKDFGTGPIHLAAYLLDPTLQGSLLEPLQLIDAMSFIYECATNMKLDVRKVRENLTDYRDKQGLFSRTFLWEGVGETHNKIKPLLWWRGLRGTCDVADVAIRILGAPVTSAATERTFSTFSWIHSKKRNRLSSERAAKLTYLSYNWKLMNVQTEPKKSGECTDSAEQTQTVSEEQNIQEREEEDEEDEEDPDGECDEVEEEEEDLDEEGLMDYESD